MLYARLKATLKAKASWYPTSFEDYVAEAAAAGHWN